MYGGFYLQPASNLKPETRGRIYRAQLLFEPEPFHWTRRHFVTAINRNSACRPLLYTTYNLLEGLERSTTWKVDRVSINKIIDRVLEEVP